MQKRPERQKMMARWQKQECSIEKEKVSEIMGTWDYVGFVYILESQLEE